LSPKKSEFLQTRIRILGKLISHGKQTLSLEKREKIEQLTFPKTREEALSTMAFFAWFQESCSGMGAKLSGLRNMIKSREKAWEPNQELKDQFEDLKVNSLNKDTGNLSILSPKTEDKYVVFCDASLGGLGALLCQIMPKRENLDQEWNRSKNAKKYLFLIRF
jgi:hypothetical protein